MGQFDSSIYKNYERYIVSDLGDGIRHVQIDNPKVLNAFDERMWRDYAEILETLDSHDDTNIIIISSACPKAFSSGLNLKDAIKTMASSKDFSEKERYEGLYKHIKDFQHSIGTPARINTPTICLLNGVCYGLALDMLACCSIRVMTEDARLSIREIKIGIPADIGSLQRLPSIVNNKSLLYQYALTGATFGAAEAEKLGIVSKIVSNLEEGIKYCTDLAEDIAQHQTWAIKGTKLHIQQILDGSSVEQGLNNVAKYNATHIDGKFISAMSNVKL
ncbi:Piso0_002765 [Millerozyma farinosa CBS 7064]|uniref:Piso0_002765 protein n=1 Tax=Pichia sorbitophila (strain ATCC MYA-4447 / BCRC 22081 / CBS 7064 / NBRC 10061 / NRRL Y-12695) TaxID=559304 RepID=G8YDG1_PICSO|nr:Piso0_002765 [Millerozyma farinosa CBS 7064]